jgi:hypothetical protein
MKCPDIGTIQSYIDCELNLELRKKVENHISQCKACESKYLELKENDSFVFDKMRVYKQYFEDAVMKNENIFKEESMADESKNKKRGVSYYMKKYKKIAAIACTAAVVATCITVQPVRGAISNALSIFRVQNVKGLKISLEDLETIERKLRRGEKDINIDNMVKIKSTGGEKSEIPLEEAIKLKDFQVIFPQDIMDEAQKVTVIEDMSMEFVLDVENVNSAIKMVGGTKLFPENIDGKPVTVNIPKNISFSCELDEGREIVFNQTKTPVIEVPEGVDVDEIYNSLVELPILPVDLKNQLKSIKDWKNTIYIPVVEDSMDEIKINGKDAYAFSNGEKSSGVVWANNGVIYTISGNVEKDKIISIAESMR